MGKRRTEAFSDGVFSIAITLLILEIKVPPFIGQSNQELAWALFSLWPSFFCVCRELCNYSGVVDKSPRIIYPR